MTHFFINPLSSLFFIFSITCTHFQYPIYFHSWDLFTLIYMNLFNIFIVNNNIYDFFLKYLCGVILCKIIEIKIGFVSNKTPLNTK